MKRKTELILFENWYELALEPFENIYAYPIYKIVVFSAW